MDKEFIEKYGILIILALVLALFSCNCRIDNLNHTIEELQEKFEGLEKDKEKFLDSHCLKNLSSYCIQYKSDKKLIEDIFKN